MPTTFRRRAVVSWVTLALWAFGTTTVLGQGEAESLSASFRKAARRVLPAVVTVRPTDPRGPGGDMLPPEAVGSGVVIDAEKGFVLTNDHVIQGRSRVVVLMDDGRERTVSQIRRDPKSDLAILIIESKDLTAAPWGDSSLLDIGDWVLAIGQPFGLSGTVTAGIVSGKGRGIDILMNDDLIQTDAAINPGSSGGPLINLKGEIVGINTAFGSRRGGYEGVGFAIPATRAKRVATDLIEHGRVRRAYLGVQIGPIDPERSQRLGHTRGVLIIQVAPDGPASEAGLIRDDIVLSLDGQPIDGTSALQSAVEFRPIDQPITLTIDRGGETKELKVTPRALPEALQAPESFDRPAPPGRFGPPGPGPGSEPPLEFGPGAFRFRNRLPVPPRPRPVDQEPLETRFRPADAQFPALGLRLGEPSPELNRRFRLERSPHQGLVIMDVTKDGPADRGGLEPGMVITRLGDRVIASLDDFRQELAGVSSKEKLIVGILRGTKAEIRLMIPRDSQPLDHQQEKPESPARELDIPAP